MGNVVATVRPNDQTCKFATTAHQDKHPAGWIELRGRKEAEFR
jgi:hypothetical protein